MGNMGAMAGLWRQIQNEMRDAVSEAESKTFAAATVELYKSYADSGKPKEYDRQEYLLHSPRKTGVIGGGNEISATVYLNDGYSYSTGTYSANKVMHEAENGGSGIILKPGFWQRTESKIPIYLSNAFSKRF